MDYFDRFADELKYVRNDIYLYGAGYIAGKITDHLWNRGIELNGYIVDSKYYPKDENKRVINGKPIITAEMLTEDCVLIDAVQLNASPVKLPESEHIKRVFRLDLSSYVLFGAYPETFISENYNSIKKLYDRLCDAESRCALASFLAQRITGCYSKPFSQHESYFDEDIFLPRADEIFVDCGAFDGDTIVKFSEFLKKNGISSYKKCFAFEPDEENYKLLKSNLSDYPNIVTYKLGTHCCKDTLHFSDGKGTGSCIQNSGTVSIDVDSLDNVLNGEEITYIKMDVEGAELNSLKGAKNIIEKYRPRLAICVYHKTDDLLTIPDYILSINPDYKLYMRNYKGSGVDAVLYAV